MILLTNDKTLQVFNEDMWEEFLHDIDIELTKNNCCTMCVNNGVFEITRISQLNELFELTKINQEIFDFFENKFSDNYGSIYFPYEIEII